VGYLLYREIRDFAPADLSSGELVVALMIADDANDITRRSWIANEELCFRARMKASGVRDALSRLAGRGYEFRVIHGYGKNGRPVFAAKGHTVDYLVPDMLKGAAVAAPFDPGHSLKGAAVPHKGAAVAAPKSLKGAAVAAPLSSEDLNHLRIPSNPGPDLTPAVEGTHASRQVKTSDFPVADSGPLSQAEEFARQANGLREFEKAQSIQEAK